MVCPDWSVGTAERRFLRLIGCFSGGIRSGFRFGTLGVAVFSGSAGKNRKSPSTTRFFCIKTAGRGSAKPGSGRPISVLPRTSGIASRKYAANSGTHEHTALFAQRDRR